MSSNVGNSFSQYYFRQQQPSGISYSGQQPVGTGFGNAQALQQSFGQGLGTAFPQFGTGFGAMYPQMPAGTVIPGGPVSPQTQEPQIPGMLPLEQSYIENILRLNKGKLVNVYATFENNREWNAKVFRGVIEAAGRDHIILSDPETGTRYLILMVYVDYVTFEEEIEYSYPFGTQVSTYAPRK
jgi:spore germination protein Q